MGGALHDERRSASQAISIYGRDLVLPRAVGIKRGRAVGTVDAEVLEPVVIRHTVDVIQDERHPTPAPVLVLSAELAGGLFEAFAVQPYLEG